MPACRTLYPVRTVCAEKSWELRFVLQTTFVKLRLEVRLYVRLQNHIWRIFVVSGTIVCSFAGSILLLISILFFLVWGVCYTGLQQYFGEFIDCVSCPSLHGGFTFIADRGN